MKKKLLILLILVLAFSLTACGKSEAVKNVEAEITALETISLDSKADIEKIEADYNALTEDEQKKVENMDALDSAKAILQVVEQIETVNSAPGKDAVEAARTAYDGLDDGAKARVANYSDLESAEKVLKDCAEFASKTKGNIWFFNDSTDTVLNTVKFTSDVAIVGQISFDGNGKHDNGSNEYPFTVGSKKVTITLADGSELKIPYTISDGKVSLKKGKYYTKKQIKSKLQGFWTYSGVTFGKGNKYTAQIKNNKIKAEWAAESFYSSTGEYFYYGPYGGTFKLMDDGGFDVEMRHGDEYFFCIVNGKVRLLHYNNVFTPSKITSFPGQNGYSF